MTETIAEYKARIASYVEGKDSLAVQRETYQTLAGLVEGLSEAELDRERAPGKWSVREILAHLAEVEAANTWRYRQILEHEGAALAAYDQDEWARLGSYQTRDVKESLETFRLLRKNNLELFDRLTGEERQRFGMHVERGKMTVEELFRQIAGHDLNHIEQVRETVQKFMSRR